jgi:tRNA threonylcarbamoyl adenosine modification protein (Sua5/YciO/YrdC/YwlC family)
MAKILTIHPDNPQLRLIKQVVEVLEAGGVIVYPTDSAYALACHLGDKQALQRIRQIKQLDEKHHLTLICRDMSEISTYARVDNAAFRFIKAYTPGPYTFILPATREVPRRLQHPKRKTIGIRIPDNPIAQAVLNTLNAPMMTTTLALPNESLPLLDIDDIAQQVGDMVDIVVDGGYCGFEETTIVDLVTDTPQVLRQGKGEVIFMH